MYGHYFLGVVKAQAVHPFAKRGMVAVVYEKGEICTVCAGVACHVGNGNSPGGEAFTLYLFINTLGNELFLRVRHD